MRNTIQLTTTAAQIKVGDRIYFQPVNGRKGVFRPVTMVLKRGWTVVLRIGIGEYSRRCVTETVLIERTIDESEAAK